MLNKQTLTASFVIIGLCAFTISTASAQQFSEARLSAVPSTQIDFRPIVRLAYRDIMGIEGLPEAVDFWNSQMQSGTSEAKMREIFLRSDEYKLRHPSLDNPSFLPVVDLAYRQLLLHTGNSPGWAFWGDQLRTITEARMREIFIRSEEFRNLHMHFYPVVRLAYADILQRPADADPAGLDFWSSQVAGGMTEETLREIFIRSEEYAFRHSPEKMALRVIGNQFVNQMGWRVDLQGASICCFDAKSHWWPSAVDFETIDRLAAMGVNLIHIRLGPFTVAGESSINYVAYVTLPDGRVDLNQWYVHFWGLSRSIVDYARIRGITVEVDMFDRWVRKHGSDDLPDIDPWQRQNNVNGISAGGLGIFQREPGPVHIAWIRKIVLEFGGYDNVIFNTGNEAFESFSFAWEDAVRRIIKDELRKNGYPDRLVGTTTHSRAVENISDYIVRHSPAAQTPESKPVIVSEYAGLSPEDVIYEIQQARAMGTFFSYFRGDHDDNEWLNVLMQIRQIIETQRGRVP